MEKTKIFTYAGTVLKNLFRKPATIQYPFQPADYPERMRGHIEIDIEDCISCGLCMRACPSSALKVDRKAGTWEINRFDCVQCGYCVSVCPKKCLMMKKGYTAPETGKSWETYKKPEQPKTEPSAAAGGRPAMDPEKCVYCTLCAKKCPQGAIEVDRKEKTWKLDSEKCVECGLCASSCPKKAIEMKG